MSERERQIAEEARQAAEVERERREELRRIGEGGPEQHVPGNVQTGRVEAEAQRVVAEQDRVGMRAFYLRVTGLLALPVAFIALIPALVGVWLLDRETDARISENRALAGEGVRAHDALCILRDDLRRRADDTEKFIDEIDRGVRPAISGISRADLLRSLEARRSTLKALAHLKC